ncbi:MAG: ATP-binding protein [Nitrospiraceae bacterium]|nr:ATP-binding protein [Nitrospiraceae bacterium]
MEKLIHNGRPLHRIRESLAAKLILSIAALVLLGGGASWYLLISTGRDHLMKDAVDDAASYSDLVRKSTRYSMITVHRDAIQRTIEEIASRKEIERIRIFDSRGSVFYASQRDEVGSIVGMKDGACSGCHREAAGGPVVDGGDQWMIGQGNGERVLTFVAPFYNDPSCSSAACHVHNPGQRVLGVLETDFSLSTVDRTIRKQTRDITIFAVLFMAAIATVLYAVLDRFVLAPVTLISRGMQNVAAGHLAQSVSVASADEMGQLSDTFNMMTKELSASRDRMADWTKALEEGIAKKTDELKRSQDKLIQAEKLASLGRLTADVAHEIRNPLTAVGGFARRLFRIAAAPKEKEYAGIMLEEVDRLEKILKDVLTFSRDAKSRLERQDLREIAEEALQIYGDLCAEQSVRIEVRAEGEIFPVLVDRDQVRQAVRNLLNNAVDAMPEGGRLTLASGGDEINGVPYMYLRVSDTGPGIREEDLPLIFEPFYTTKKTGHGTGLGLSITRKIMEEHGGFVRAENNGTGGSSFSLYFPYQDDDQPGMKCWEYMQCGRDRDASMKCPAYPNFGRICWAVAGTFCEGKVQGTFAQKYEDCQKCEYFRKMKEGGSQG